MKKKYNFPFFGASRAIDFEWPFVEVFFTEIPTTEQKKQIKKNVPFPIREIIYQKNFMCAAGSASTSHIEIAKTYQTKDGLDPNAIKNWKNGRYFASRLQLDAFHIDVERWLNEIHEVTPIIFAFLQEDSTNEEYSDWHIWSLKQFESISPYFDEVVADSDYKSIKAEALLDILYFLEKENILLSILKTDKYINYNTKK